MRNLRNRVLLGLVLVLAVVLAGCPEPKVVVTVTPADPNLELGQAVALTAVSTDPEDTVFNWTSDGMDCVLVAKDGQAQALRLGTVTVRAKGSHSGAIGQTKVTVAPPAGFNQSLPVTQGQPAVAQTNASLQGCLTEVTVPGVSAQVCQEGIRVFHDLHMGGAAETGEPGKPRLPFLSYDFVLPRDSTSQMAVQWDVSVTKESVQTFDGIVPYPSQPTAWLDDLPAVLSGQKQAGEPAPPDRPAFVFDEQSYSSQAPYPGNEFVAETYTVGDLDVVRVRVYPVQYRGAEKRLEVATKMKIALGFHPGGEAVAPAITGDYTGTTPPDVITEVELPNRFENGGSIIQLGPTELVAELPHPDIQSIHDEYFQLLMLTRSDLYDEARRLAEHRQAEGWRVYLATLASGNWEHVDESMALLWDQNALEFFGYTLHPLRALLIFGDTEHIETHPGMNYRGYARPTDPAESVSIVGTDNRFATLAGDDYIPEFCVGRISVNNITEAEAVVSKIIRYEDQIGGVPPHNMATYAYFQEEPTPWLELDGDVTFTVGSKTVTGSGTAFESHYYPSIYADYIRIQGGYDGYEKWARIDYVVSDRRLELMDPFGGPSDVTGTAELGYLDGRDNWEFVKGAERVRQFMLDRGCLVHFGYVRSRGPVPQRAFDGSDLPDDLLSYLWDTSTADIQSRWRQGHDGIVLHVDHGARSGWVHPHFRNGDVVSRSSALLGFDPIVLSMNCGSGWFDNECDMRAWGDGSDRPDTDTGQNSECFAETALRQPDGGAVAVVAAIRGSDAGRNDKLIDGIFGAFYGDYEEGTMAGRTRHVAATRLGDAFLAGKLHQLPYMGNETYMQYNMEIYHLFGDPLMRLNLPEPAR